MIYVNISNLWMFTFLLTNIVATQKISLKPAGCLHLFAVSLCVASNKDTSPTLPSAYSYSPSPISKRRGWNCFLFVLGKSGHTSETITYGRDDCKSWEEPHPSPPIPKIWNNCNPGDTFHSRIISCELVGCCELISVKNTVLSKQWWDSSWKVEGKAGITIFLKPEQLKSFVFPHYTFLSLSEMLSDWTVFLGKNLFPLKFGIGKFRLSNFAGSAWQ